MFAGSVAAAVILGAPDLVLLTLTELGEQVRRITRASSLSLIVDADHGYGNALNVMRTVQELERAGAAALTVEDTLLPEAFGGSQGERLISVSEFVGKLKAALAAREDSSLVIIGRTAALRAEGMAEAVKRVQACAEAGVDAVFIVGLKDREEVRTLSQAAPLPVLLGAIPAALDDRAFLAAHGVRAALQGHIPFQIMIKALYDTYEELKAGSSLQVLKTGMAAQEVVEGLLRSGDYERWRREYLGKK
jgi:carboxyvinyl-carboxyphosphonate phosphorylmutase